MNTSSIVFICHPYLLTVNVLTVLSQLNPFIYFSEDLLYPVSSRKLPVFYYSFFTFRTFICVELSEEDTDCLYKYISAVDLSFKDFNLQKYYEVIVCHF